MISLVALFAMAAAPVSRVQDPPRLRTILDNGSIILVEPRPSATISLQLFASSKHVIETEASHGYRHLLEHLIVRGPNRELDRKLETEACFLKASTLRDAMQVEITLGPDQLDLGLAALSTMLRKPSYTQERIDKEVRVIRDEMAMQDDAALLSSASWLEAYGDEGLDPLGDFESLFRATPEKVEQVYVDNFASDGLVVVVTGPVKLEEATKKVAALLAPRAKYLGTAVAKRGAGKPGVTPSEGSGESRAATVPGFNYPQTAAALIAAFGIAADVPDCFVTYTPTLKNGLIIVGRTNQNSGLGSYIDKLESPELLMGVGRKLARQWVQRQLDSETGNAYLRGLLLIQGASYKPETLLDSIAEVDQASFLKGYQMFKSDKAVAAVGKR